MATITELYNNIVYDHRFTKEWGFSCFIEEAGLLFDTGGDGAILLNNMNAAGIAPSSIKGIVLSHDHWDHTGGLEALLPRVPGVPVYVPEGFGSETLSLIEDHARPVIIDGWTAITDWIFTTGPLGDAIIEQSLAIKTEKGYFAVVGCSHPHISTILSEIGRRGIVWGVMGGFHTVHKEDIDCLKGLSYLSASHCTQQLDTIKERYPDIFVNGGAGKVHTL
jgi:7,8-dihydropterin-6-yl-methyl-4-(beta-D-ribofuranosyl)aminobenzene 5'-phosphate synthase